MTGENATPVHLTPPRRVVTVAATKFACGWDAAANIAKAESLVRRAAAQGAQVILLQELFETPYFCIEQDSRHLRLATSLGDNPAVRRMTDREKQELTALVQEHCFFHLEAPIERVTGWDTPYPHALEWAYFPGPERVGAALQRVMEG